MKLKHFGLFLLISTLAVFSACGDDDDDNKGGAVVDLATEVKGDYKGQLVVAIEVEGVEPTESTQSVSLVRTGDNEVKLELKDFSIEEFLPTATDISLTKIVLEGKSGDVKIKENEQLITLLGVIKADVTTNGTVKGEDIDLKLDIVSQSPKMNVTVTFKGKIVK